MKKFLQAKCYCHREHLMTFVGPKRRATCAICSRRRNRKWLEKQRQKRLEEHRACELAGIDPRVHRYRSRRPDDDVLRKRLRDLASERRRFGYRRTD